MGDRPGYRDRPDGPAMWLRSEALRRLPEMRDEISALRGLARDILHDRQVRDRRKRLREIHARIQAVQEDVLTAMALVRSDPLTWDDMPPIGSGART